MSLMSEAEPSRNIDGGMYFFYESDRSTDLELALLSV
jgi:hypothetical protein